MILKNAADLIIGGKPAVRAYYGGRIVWEKNKGRLPAGYTELEYIESLGAQWINTGFCPNPKTTRIDTTFQVTSVAKQNQRLLGARAATNDPAKMCSVFWNTSSAVRKLRLDWMGSTGSGGAEQTINTDITLVCENNVAIENGVEYKSATAKYDGYLSWPLYIGTMATNGDLTSTNPNAPSRWKTFRIYDDGALVRDFVPCISLEKEIGMYDLIGGKFYASDGKGDFLPSGVDLENINYNYMYDNLQNYNEYFKVYSLQMAPNTTYILATNVPYTDTESSFIAASTSSNLNAADGGLFDSRTITTDSDGILRIAARIKNGVAQPGLSSNKSKFGSGTWWLRVAAI